MSFILVKNAGTDRDMWYIQLSSCRREEYFVAKLACSVVIVSSVYQIYSEVNTEHSFSVTCSCKEELFWKELWRILYFYTLNILLLILSTTQILIQIWKIYFTLLVWIHINTSFLDVTLCWLTDRHHCRGTSTSILINVHTVGSSNVLITLTQITRHHIQGE